MKIAIYKPSKNMNSGCAFQFSMGTKRNSNVPVMFIEAVRQSKPKPPAGSAESPFEWKENKVTMMLNADELGDLCACVTGMNIDPGTGRRKPLEFVHTSERNGVKQTAVFKLAPPQNESELRYGNWGIQVSLSRDGSLSQVRGFIGPGHVYRLKSLADYILMKFNDLEERPRLEREN